MMWGEPEERAVELLLSQRLYSLRFDVTKFLWDVLLPDADIVFDSLEGFCRKTKMTVGELSARPDFQDGCTIVQHRSGGRPLYIVLYREARKNAGRRAFTLAHEVGHILLGHRDDGDAMEKQADRFASELLLPRILLAELQNRAGGTLTAQEVSGLFSVSVQMASRKLAKTEKNRDWPDSERCLLKKCRHLLPLYKGPEVTV